MKTIRAHAGPFAERPFYSNAQIESICTEALLEVKLFPERPEPVRIERFIERRFGVVPEYADLGPGVLGYTEFGSKGVAGVYISRELEEGKADTDRRLFTTFAHEGGHCLLHAHLFAFAADHLTLFGDDPDVTATRIMCWEVGESQPVGRQRKPYDGKWWEWQASQCIGPLLMPRRFVVEVVGPFLAERGKLGVPVLENGKRQLAIRAVAETFEVNPAAARVRLAAMFPAAGSQLTL